MALAKLREALNKLFFLPFSETQVMSLDMGYGRPAPYKIKTLFIVSYQSSSDVSIRHSDDFLFINVSTIFSHKSVHGHL